jgi:hypothetical protein
MRARGLPVTMSTKSLFRLDDSVSGTAGLCQGPGYTATSECWAEAAPAQQVFRCMQGYATDVHQIACTLRTAYIQDSSRCLSACTHLHMAPWC